MSTERDQDISRKSRHVAVVIAGSMVIWFGANILGGIMEWPGRYALLFDFAALAALAYAMVNIYQIWRLRQGNK